MSARVTVRDNGQTGINAGYVVYIDGVRMAEYGYAPQQSSRQRAASRHAMRALVQQHLATGGTAGNYQW